MTCLELSMVFCVWIVQLQILLEKDKRIWIMLISAECSVVGTRHFLRRLPDNETRRGISPTSYCFIVFQPEN